MLTITLPLALAVLGLLVMALASNPTAREAGKGAYWAGMFALAFALSHLTLHL